MNIEIYNEFDHEAEAIIAEYQDKEWKRDDVLYSLSQKLRKLATDYTCAGKFRGFTLDLNKVDCCNRPVAWPANVYEHENLEVQIGALGVEEDGAKPVFKYEIKASAPIEAPVIEAPVVEESEEHE